MINLLTELFTYDYIIRAFIVGSLVSLCSALLGVTLVLKRYSMIGDGLSHVGFGALCFAIALNMAPLAVSIPIIILAAYLLLRLNENNKIKSDSAIALISSSSLAIGMIILSLVKGVNTDVSSFMFGSILAMQESDVIISVTLSIFVLIIYLLFYNKIFSITFDENFAKATGTKVKLFNSVIAFLTAITIVIGMRIMGTLLISSLIIFPALTSMRIFKTFKLVTISSAIVSVICFCLGIIASFVFSLPAGPSVVVANLIMFILFDIIRRYVKIS